MDKQAAVDVTTNVVEAAFDATESTVNALESVPTIVKNNPIVLVGVAVISLAVGAAVATVISNKRFEKKYADIAEEEIQDAKVFYSQRYKTGEYSDPVALVEQLADENDDDVAEEDTEAEAARDSMVKAAVNIMENQQYVAYDKLAGNDPPEDEAVTEEVVEVKNVTTVKKNVFRNVEPTDEDPFDFELEEAKRANDEPYIIQKDDFFRNEDELTESQLTYYVEDDTLADENGAPISHYEPIIGSDNLRFGVGSQDNTIVYVRNDELDGIYEIKRHTGSFAREVYGLDTEDVRPAKRFDRYGE